MPDAVVLYDSNYPDSQPIGTAGNPLYIAGEFNVGDVTLDTSLLATSAKQDTLIGHVDGVETLLGTIDADTGNIETSTSNIDSKTPALGQALAAASTPVVLTAAEEAQIGALTETAPATDTASSGLNGRLQRISQRLTSLLASIGDTADAVVAAGAAGSLSAKLRAISRDLVANIVLAAGENLIGKIASSAIVLVPTWTVDTAVYAPGDSIGGKIVLTGAVRVSGGTSLLYHIHIFDRSGQKPTGNILIFNADPTVATITDNAAFVYSTDDFKQVAAIPVASSDYKTVNTKVYAELANLGRQVKPVTGTNLWAVFVTDGAPDFVATSDLQIIFKFIPVD